MAALTFDGSQNYLNLGTMGNFGANLGSGFYASFQIKTTQTAQAIFGTTLTGTKAAEIGFNTNSSFNSASSALAFYLRGNSSGTLMGGVNSPSVTWNDGNVHTIVITATPGTNTITISIDGTAQTISYSAQSTPGTFVNFPNAFYLGCRNNGGSASVFMACTLYNFNIGTSSSALYGSYPDYAQSALGTTLIDVSGNGNNGTLSKFAGAYPTWVNGASAPNMLQVF